MTISSTYDVVKLSDYVYYQEGPGIRNHQNTVEGIKFLNIRCFINGRLDTASMKKVAESEALGKYKHFLLDAGDYVVSSSGTLGRIAEVYSEDLPVMLNTSTIRFRPLDNLFLDRLYLRYFLESEVFQQQVKSLATGSVQLNYGPSHLAFVEMPLPPIKIQKVIGKVLDSITRKIDLNNKTSKTLEDIAQTIFKSWFIDFDPVKAKMAGEKAVGMDAATAAQFPDSMEQSELGLIPKGWTVEKFGEVNDLLMGQSPPGDTYNSEGDGLPFYQGRTDFGFRFPKQRIFCTKENRVALPGETLVSVRAPVGDVNQAIEKCIIGRGVASTMHKSKSGAYTYSLLKSLYPRLAYYNGEGTVFGAINRSDFNNMSIVEPTASLVESYEVICGPMNQEIRSLFLATEALIQLRDSLLPRLISGELQIPEEMLAS
jgi:type I restriction enzyme S subunit